MGLFSRRYGSPGNTTKEYTEFAELFLKEYAVPAQQVRTSRLLCDEQLPSFIKTCPVLMIIVGHVCLPGAAESLIPIQGKAIRGSQSTPTDAQLHQPGHSTRSDVEKPQATHPGMNTTHLNDCYTTRRSLGSPASDCLLLLCRASFKTWSSLSCATQTPMKSCGRRIPMSTSA